MVVAKGLHDLKAGRQQALMSEFGSCGPGHAVQSVVSLEARLHSR